MRRDKLILGRYARGVMRGDDVGRRLGLVGGAALISGGLWVAVVGAGGGGGSGSPTLLPTGGSPVTTATETAIYTSAATVVGEPMASPTLDVPPTKSPTVEATAVAGPASSAPSTATPRLTSIATATLTQGAAPTARALPKSSAFTVIDLSRLVRLPSGRTFSACVTSGPEGEPWPSAVHDYWVVGTADWVIETHIGDVGIIYEEDRGTFRVRNIERAGC